MTLRAGTILPVGLVACVLQLSACATITRTQHADWKADTIPQGATLTASNGGSCDATPCTLRVLRKESFTATMTKTGYKPMTVEVRPGLTPAGDVAFVGNILIGGVIGMGVDLYTGAALEPMPSGTPFRLSPVGYAGACTPEKADYAAFLGVPCASLGGAIPGMQPAASPATRTRR